MTDQQIAARVADAMAFLVDAGMREHADAIGTALAEGIRREQNRIVERDRAITEADRLRTAWEQAWAERNDARSCVAELEGRARAVEALLTSGPIGRASGERYVRADYIRAALADESGDGAAVAPIPHCACGATAAFGVGYHGEGATVFQCTRCATEDRRTPFFHRDVQSYVVKTCGPTPNGLVCACGGLVGHSGSAG